jgi:putative transcriptional regulator
VVLVAGLGLWIAGATNVADAHRDLRGQLRRGAVKELAAGKLLVAARNLPDPNFAETVVLLADFNEQGAMGLILNRRTDVTLARAAPGLQQPPAQPTLVFFGGPVAVPGVLALLRSTSAPLDARRILADVYLVNTREGLERTIATGADSNRFRVYVGYAGWGAGQLEAEAAQGAWHVSTGDADVVFDPEPESAWQRQIRRTEALQADRRQGESPVRAISVSARTTEVGARGPRARIEGRPAVLAR